MVGFIVGLVFSSFKQASLISARFSTDTCLLISNCPSMELIRDSPLDVEFDDTVVAVTVKAKSSEDVSEGASPGSLMNKGLVGANDCLFVIGTNANPDAAVANETRAMGDRRIFVEDFYCGSSKL